MNQAKTLFKRGSNGIHILIKKGMKGKEILQLEHLVHHH